MPNANLFAMQIDSVLIDKRSKVRAELRVVPGTQERRGQQMELVGYGGCLSGEEHWAMGARKPGERCEGRNCGERTGWRGCRAGSCRLEIQGTVAVGWR